MHTVTAAQAGKFLASHQDALILDVRTPRERLNGYIPHSRSVPVCDILSGAYAPPQDKPLLLTCASGGRSLAAAKFLAHEGYTRVYNLRGGFSAWRQAGLPVEKQ